MHYNSELNFFRRLLEKMRIQSHVVSQQSLPSESIDMGLRKYLGREHEYLEKVSQLPEVLEENTVYKFTDAYFCNYAFFLLPETEGELALILGPYLSFDASPETVLQKAELLGIPVANFRQIEAYYMQIPFLPDDASLMIPLTTLAERLWGTGNAYKIIDLALDQRAPSVLMPEQREEADSILRMELMQRRYDFENDLLDKVSKGLWHRARLLLISMNRPSEQRLSDLLRNQKNYCIICNTLLRKAAEKGGVHPLYLDKISSQYARQIELVTSTQHGQDMIAEMVQGYCRLVRRHNLKNYSPLIQKTLLYIDAEIATDLGLARLSKLHNVSPEYLSSLFHKETGKTLTAFVNEKRLELGADLLRSSSLQVQTISEYCGFSDAGYFAKLFKKRYGMSPKAFREHKDSPSV